LWQWWAYDEWGTRWDRQRGFVDRATELNCQYYLVDEGWQNPTMGWCPNGDAPWIKLKELCDYAATKNVRIWVWAGSRPDTRLHRPGLETAEKRRIFFDECAAAGVAGLKIDFIDSESHTWLGFYQDCLRLAAERKMMLDFHGANKPAGEARTWPNEMTREGIFGLEMNKWNAMPPDHYAILIFTRAVLGGADFTPTTFQASMAKGTSMGFQLASAMLYVSPFLTWADKPDLYLKCPAVEMIRTLPTVWDETRVLPGTEVGGLTALARRSGTTWWVAVINPATESRHYALKLDFLQTQCHALMATDSSQWEMKDVAIKPSAWEIQTHKAAPYTLKLPVRLGDQSRLVMTEKAVHSGETIDVSLEPTGGFVMRLVP
jgi:hypothetical protein